MSREPRPLPTGASLHDRFEVVRTLGSGGFGIAYLAQDSLREDLAVIKELAPTGSRRSDDNLLVLGDAQETSPQRLRHRFLEEAQVLAKLNLPGILPVRAAFEQFGTAYYATDFIDEATTLETLLQREGRLDVEGALDILFQLMETLEGIHERGFLHRDIKPSNILIDPKGIAYLIDFGAAREWHADSLVRHTVLYTPGYAPIEQMSERARRGPATDIYALCATAYHMLTGSPPTPAADRVAGAELVWLRSIRPDVERKAAAGIESGLHIQYTDRPQSIAALREMLSAVEDDHGPVTLADLDQRLFQLQRFSFQRRECPSCGGVLGEPKPLRKGACPVCRNGVIRKRIINERLCPACKVGALRFVRNDAPLAFCPLCRVGELSKKRRSLLSPILELTCPNCSAGFESTPTGMVATVEVDSRFPIGASRSWDEWRAIGHRSTDVWRCDSCPGQFDVEADGRWALAPGTAELEFDRLYPEEWARVAIGLPPGAGNADCDSCEADYYLEGEQLTLLSAHKDPFRFAERHLGRLIDLETARWLGAGKESPAPGPVCEQCHAEFDKEGVYLRLVRSDRAPLRRRLGRLYTLEDWHRIGAGLPTIDEEPGFHASIEHAVAEAYRSGEIGFDAGGGTIWKGAATRIDDGQSGNLVVSQDEISFGGLIRRWKAPLEAVLEATDGERVLTLRLSGEREPVEFEIEDVELTVKLESGSRTILLGAPDLAQRINRRVELGRGAPMA